MKKTLLFIVLLFGMSMQSWACVDPNPDSVIVNMSIDTVNCDLIVEITNLRIMGGNPNQFCSCGVNDVIAGLGDVVYLVFVDSTTHEPVIGFNQFELNELAGDEWNLSDPSFDWSGFISDINGAGLLPDQAVTLWIRIDLYDTVIIDGVEFNPCIDPYNVAEFAFAGALGTDEWNNANGTLAEDHQSIAYFYNNDFYFNIVPDGYMDYFDGIVEGFYSGIEENIEEAVYAYPNPVIDRLFVGQIPKDVEEINLINIYGQVVRVESANISEINMSNFPSGIYLLQYVGLKQDYLTKIVKL